MMTDFYADRRVVITGAAGMIGSALCRRLVAAGALVVGLDNFSRGKTRVDGVRYACNDAGREDVCYSVFKAHQADAVFNLAAFVAGVEYNQAHHVEMFTNNVRLLAAPVQGALRAGVKHFLQTSTVCVYTSEYQAPAIEAVGTTGEPAAANAGYSWAKRMGERVARWAAENGEMHAVIVRPTNAHGIGDYFDERAHVIPSLIRKCLEDDPIIVNGGTETREFIWAGDVAAGMMAALARGRSGRAYNLGTHGETRTTIRDLLALIQELTGTQDKPVEWRAQFGGGDPDRYTDCGRAHRELGWRHEVGLREGLERLVEWYRGEVEK